MDYLDISNVNWKKCIRDNYVSVRNISVNLHYNAIDNICELRDYHYYLERLFELPPSARYHQEI